MPYSSNSHQPTGTEFATNILLTSYRVTSNRVVHTHDQTTFRGSRSARNCTGLQIYLDSLRCLPGYCVDHSSSEIMDKSKDHASHRMGRWMDAGVDCELAPKMFDSFVAFC